MRQTSLSATQRRAGYGMMTAIVGCYVWAASPDLADWRGVLAKDRTNSRPIRSSGTGATLHGGEVAPPPAMRSCVACHALGGGFGGGSTYQTGPAFAWSAQGGRRPRLVNVEVFRSAAGSPLPSETSRVTKTNRPDGGVCPSAGAATAGPVNALALFGLGLVDRIPNGAIVPPGPGPRVARVAGSEVVVPGRPRILPYGRVGKFGSKAQYATLIEFVAATCDEEAMADGATDEAVEGRLICDSERIREVLEFVGNISRPEAVAPGSAAESESARRGEAHFAAVGCTACHAPDIGGLRGVYGDFLLHRLDDRSGGPASAATEPPQGPPTADPLPDEWRTAPLWGVADSAPYLHDGSAATLEEAIARHRGDAEATGRAYDQLGEVGRGDLVAFLRTLKAPTTVRARPAQP